MKIKQSTIYKIVAGTAAAVVAVTVLGGATYTLDEGVRGVILRNGKVVVLLNRGYGTYDQSEIIFQMSVDTAYK